ncbi:MAG: hypothetical protein OEY95_02940 [Candidatus Bathyarchaeota archaeon]|nr:hypothetical protein [Candidatus Bathyarchaeota archaeon]
MRRTKAFLLLTMILIPSYILITAPPAKADEGYAKVYIICLPDVGGWTFPDRPFDPSRVKEGAIKALSFKDSTNLPRAHPKLGKAPPFYGISYQVVTDWYTYKSIIESSKGVIVINTHGEITPVPSGYSREGWTDKIAEAMLKRRATWVHTAGYPFYYAWYQGASQKEDNPPWGPEGFKRLMSHINKGTVDCLPIISETNPVRVNTNAEDTLSKEWKIQDAFFAQYGRPLKASDFGNYTILPIWGTWDGYMTGGVIAFVKPSERALPEERYGFGAYVHIGTNGTWDLNEVSTDGDYYRGYVGAAAAIWTEVEAFEPTAVTKEYVEHVAGYSYYTAWGFGVTPVITCYAKVGNTLYVWMDFGIYGVMKTNGTDWIGKVEFYLSCPSDCIVMMHSNRSKNGYNYGNSTVGIDWKKWGWYGFKVGLFIVGAVLTKGTLPIIIKGIGGAMLVSDFFSLFPSITNPIQGVDEIQPPNREVEFKYDPSKYYTEPGDGYRYGEFESTIHIELQVNMANREQWTVVPLDWYVGLLNTAGSYVASTWSRASIALFDDYDSPNYEATVFFDDFKDMDGWSIGDANSLAGYDYWGTWSEAAALHCAGVGTNSLNGEKPNLEAGQLGDPRYDKCMDAYLTRSIDLRPYRNAWLRYSLGYVISSGDHLAVEYYSNSVWNNLNIHTGAGPSSSPVEVQLPTTATQIRFRFYSNDDNSVSWGVRLDYVEITAEFPNDANSMNDAGNSFGEATVIQISESLNNYAGYLNDDEDWYKFEITSTHISKQRKIYVWLNPPSNSVFNLTLYDKYGNKKAGPVSSGQALTYILSSSDQAGWWRIKILPVQGFGQYNFDIQLKRLSLTVKTCKTTGSEISNVKVWVDDVQYYSPVTLELDAGTHTVEVESYFFKREWWLYTFDHWEDGSTNNPRTISVNSDVTIKAYYTVDYLCPTLFVWNGSQYVYKALLDIHAESDIRVQHQIQQTLVLDGLFYKLQLRELDNFTSHIDQVKLYAVDHDGEWHTCLLIIAKHNDAYVTLKLLFDDDTRVDLAPSEIINLKFLPSIPHSQTAHFIFEITGYNRKIP